MPTKQFLGSLANYLENSPTPFHAAANLEAKLVHRGFEILDETKTWQLKGGGKYVVRRNDGALIAFQLVKDDYETRGFRMIGAHTDSPALKVKPNPINAHENYINLGVEPYGGVLLNTWFDRDLALAGRISYLKKDGKFHTGLVDIHEPLGFIPSLAIHLDREANESRSINKQTDLPPLVMQIANKEKVDFRNLLLQLTQTHNPELEVAKILDYELYFYDCNPPQLTGLNKPFLVSARLDNLLSCYVGMKALTDASPRVNTLLYCSDHEECGSQSMSGADGSFLRDVLTRICGDANKVSQSMAQSYMVSCDNAHAVHPNYIDRHDRKHGPLLNAGPVIKINANQRYATTSETAGLIRHFAELDHLPIQEFVVRSDMACGSTIGPMTSASLGVKTIDIGIPTLGMHSIREMAGTEDATTLIKLLIRFLNY